MKEENYQMISNMQKAIFLDKDGTLIHDVPYNINPSLISFTDNALPGLKKLAALGFLFIVVTNQQGIAYGYFTEEEIKRVKSTLEILLQNNGIHLTDFYFCPHFKNAGCFCRKPQPGMFFKAASSHKIDLSNSWMIGDTLSDIEAGKHAGCKTILFAKGYENARNFTKNTTPDFIVSSLLQAADIIQQNQENTHISNSQIVRKERHMGQYI